jgi:calcium/calmodulin-dependent protein kinase I
MHQVRNEIAVLKKVSMGHRNILTLVDYFETMNNCTRSPGARCAPL